MKNYLHILSIYSWFIIAFIFEWLLTRSDNSNILSSDNAWWFIIAVIIILLLLIGLIKFITLLSWLKLNFWMIALNPVVFFSSAFLFFLVLDGVVIKYIFWLMIMLVMLIYIYNIWLFYQRPYKYQAFTLENFSWYMSLLTSFFLSAGIFGFIIFIDFSIWWALIVISVYCFFGFYYLWWVQKVENKSVWFFILAMVLIGVESFIALKFLPFSFYLLAFWWTSLWLVSTRLSIDLARGIFKPKVAKYFVGIILLVAIILTATTRWF